MELSDIENEILAILGSEARELSTIEIAKRLRKSRQTTGKYLEFLRLKDLIVCRKLGPANLWLEKASDIELRAREVLSEVLDEFHEWLAVKESHDMGQIDKEKYLRGTESHMLNIGRTILAQSERLRLSQKRMDIEDRPSRNTR